MNQVCPSIINSQGELCVSVPHFSCLYAMQRQISVQRYACSAIWVIRKLAKILWRCECVKKLYTSIIEIKY